MPDSARIDVRLKPRGHSDRLEGFRDGVLQARVTAPPLEGRANTALRRLVAKRLGVPVSRVRVVRGERSKSKVLEVVGVGEDAIRARLGD